MASTIRRCENLDVLVLMGSPGKAACAVTAIGGNSPDFEIRYVIDVQIHRIEGDWVLQ
ncbi:MAG: hypothetical protein C5S33_04500 [ANME-2 cluster archaeon]|nr:hypothetical protein [ANME-2 cluster archaeon]